MYIFDVILSDKNDVSSLAGPDWPVVENQAAVAL